MGKLTIEIDEGPDQSALHLSVDGERLGVITSLRLDSGKLDVVTPAVEVDVASDLSQEAVEKMSPELRKSVERTVGLLRKFRCVEVYAPEGI